MVAVLLEAGADVNAVHSLVGAPLHFACSTAPLENRVEIIELLLRYGADPNVAKTYDNGTTLKSPLVEYFRQRENADPRIVKLFFCHGVRIVMRSPASDPRGQLRNLIRLFVARPELFSLLVDLGEQFDRTAVERLPIPESIKVHLMQRTSNPGNLQQLARQRIRSLVAPLNPSAVDSLPLPRILKSYLLGLTLSH
uniref:SOCS box domain-containing protein n=1 Tax=Steinernema glaseri TaxID=37863 RepID=A0A1I8AC92_9BILA